MGNNKKKEYKEMENINTENKDDGNLNAETLDEVEKHDQEMNSRLDRLYGVSDEAIKRRSELTDEEKKDVRKKMIFLIWFVPIMIIIMIVSNFFNPFSSVSSKTPLDDTAQQEGIDELQDGDIDINNEVIKNIDSKFNIEVKNPLYDSYILNLYSGNVSTETMDFNTKMLLLTSTQQFKDFLKDDFFVLDSEQVSGGNGLKFVISTSTLRSISNNVFGNNVVLNYENFKFYYNDSIVGDLYFDAILQKDYYDINQIDNVNNSISVHEQLISAHKKGNQYSLKYNVLFVNDNGIYKDPGFNEPISTNVVEVENCFSNANQYEFLYEKSNNKGEVNYILRSIKLSMENNEREEDINEN